MAEAKPGSSKPLIGSDRVEGTAVYTREGRQIGSIKRLVIEKVSGKVVYVTLSVSGFVNIGSRTYTVPWSKLNYDAKLGGYRTDITESELGGAPRFAQTGESGEESPLTEAQEEELHAHFGVPPYWRAL
jgi:hypothetical protein